MLFLTIIGVIIGIFSCLFAVQSSRRFTLIRWRRFLKFFRNIIYLLAHLDKLTNEIATNKTSNRNQPLQFKTLFIDIMLLSPTFSNKNRYFWGNAW